MYPRCAQQSKRPLALPGERGSTLLLFLIVLVLATASIVLERLTALVAARLARDDETALALASAKSALLGWAASYPDQHPTGPGPGYLPCPDIDDDGSPDTACPRHAIGRLPWRHLGLDDLRDASGQRLWYALSDNFRNNPVKVTPMNSETAGQLLLDGVDDVVAVVLAPGASLAGQARDAGPNRVANYLEGENATPGDGSFVSRAPGEDFNDRVLAITRRELMRAVEARVLAEVDRALARYRAASWNARRVLPWLSPYAAPRRAARFAATVGVREGHLPVQRPGAVFATGFTLRWGGIAGARVLSSGSVAAGELLAGAVTVAAADGRCLWESAALVDCTGSATAAAGPFVTRSFAVSIRFESTRPVVVSAPTARAARRRTLRLEGLFPAAAAIRIAVTDRQRAAGAPPRVVGDGLLSSIPGTRGRVEVEGIRYDLDVPLELPAWFVANDWHHQVYVGLAAPLQAGGGGLCPPAGGCDCTAQPACLALLDGFMAPVRVPAVAVIAGGELAGQRRETGALQDYFEGANGSPFDRVFERRAGTPAFNDQVRVIAGAAR